MMQFVRRDSLLRFSVSEINKGKCKFYHCCLDKQDKGRKQTDNSNILCRCLASLWFYIVGNACTNYFSTEESSDFCFCF